MAKRKRFQSNGSTAKKRTRSQTKGNGDGEIYFPEAILHIILSFMSCKEAAKISLVSKSWYEVWSRSPNLELPYGAKGIPDFLNKLQRYKDLDLNIDNFSMTLLTGFGRPGDIFNEMMTKIANMGIKGIDADTYCGNFGLLKFILEAKTLVKLSLRGPEWLYTFPSNKVTSSKLKSLVFTHVTVGVDTYSLKKDCWTVMFPWLEDLTLNHAYILEPIKITSPSLKRVTLENVSAATDLIGQFHVSSIRKFRIRLLCIPSRLPLMDIKTDSVDWEVDLTLKYGGSTSLGNSWRQALRKLLKSVSLSGSKVSLAFHFADDISLRSKLECGGKQGAVVENLKLPTIFPKNYGLFLKVLFVCCPPKYITMESANESFVDFMSNKLIKDGENPIANDFVPGLENTQLEHFDAKCGKWMTMSSKAWLRSSESHRKDLKIRYRLEWQGVNAPVHGMEPIGRQSSSK